MIINGDHKSCYSDHKSTYADHKQANADHKRRMPIIKLKAAIKLPAKRNNLV